MKSPGGLIETVRVRRGRAPLWPHHLTRLLRSAGALGIPLPGELAAPCGGDDRIVRLLVDRDGVSRSERPVGSTRPLALIVSAVPHPGYPHKTTDRRSFDEALAEAEAARADDAVLLGRDGDVAEATRWTLLWEDGERLVGPPLAMGILPSVARARIEEIAGPIASSRARPEALAGVPIIAANAARGIVPVRSFAGRLVPESPRFPVLAERFWP